jgi:hypothetical protein
VTTTTLAREVALDMVSTFGPWGPQTIPQQFVPSNSVFESGNRTVYVPISVPVKCTLQRFWWANGGVAAGTIAAAIYTNVDFKPLTRLATASAAQGTINTVQFVTPTAVVLTPDLYWLALASTSGSSQFFASQASASWNSVVRFQEGTGTPPATATPVSSGGNSLYLFGFSTTTTP